MTEEETQRICAQYEVRTGKNGEVGIFLRTCNVRVAGFAKGSDSLQECLKRVFQVAHELETNPAPAGSL